MDVSAFKAVAPDVPDPPLSDILDLIDDDFKVAIAAAVAVVKHVVKLVAVVVSLATCIVIQCLVIAWLCLLWLQTRLLHVNSALLRGCMDEPRRVQIVETETVPEPEVNLGEENGSTSANATEHEQVPVNHAPEQINQHDQAEDLPLTTKASTRPQLLEKWREAAFESQDKSSFGHVNLQNQASSTRTTGKAGTGNEADKHAQWESFEQTQQPAGEVALKTENNETRDVTNRPKAIAKPRPKATQQLPAKSEAPKLSKGEQKAEEQCSWLDNVTSNTTSRASSKPSQNLPPTVKDVSGAGEPRNNPFRFTADQLVEAAEFAAMATRGGQNKAQAASNPIRTSNVSMRAPKSATPSRIRRPPRVMVHSGNASLRSTAQVEPSRVENTPVSRSDAGWIAPHLRKAMEARAQRDISNGSPSGAHHSTSAVAASQIGQAESKVSVTDKNDPTPVAEKAAQQTVMQPPEAQEHTSDPKRPKWLEEFPDSPDILTSSQGPERLSYYQETPAIKQHAPHAMSAAMIKSWCPSSPSEKRAQEARLRKSVGGPFVNKVMLAEATKPQPQNEPEESRSVQNASPTSSAVEFPDLIFSYTQEEHWDPDNFATPADEQEYQAETGGDQPGKEDLNLDVNEDSSVQRELPSAAEFEAALYASQNQKEDDAAEQGRRPSTPPRTNDCSSPGEVDTLSSAKAIITQKAVRVLEEQAHVKRACTSTYATAREDTTPAHQASREDGRPSLIDISPEKISPPKEKSTQASGGKSSELLAIAPAFFAPTPMSASNEIPADGTNAALPVQVSAEFAPPGNMQPQSHLYGSTPTPFPTNTAAMNIPPHYPVPPYRSQFPGGAHPVDPYAYGPNVPSLTRPHLAPPTASFAPPHQVPHFAHPPTFSTNPYQSAPSMPSFAPDVAMAATPYPPGAMNGTQWSAEGSVVPALASPRFLGNYCNPTPSTFDTAAATPQTPYPSSSYQLSNTGNAPPIPTAPSTGPVRRSSFAVPIVRPPAPVRPPIPSRPFDLQSETAFPSLPTAPGIPSGQAPQVAKPPGLGEAQPARQAAFDAILSEASPSAPSAKPEYRTLLGRFSKLIKGLSRQSEFGDLVENAEVKFRQLDSLKDFSRTFKMPEMRLKPEDMVSSSSYEPSRDIAPANHDEKEVVQENPTVADEEHSSAAADQGQKAVDDQVDETHKEQELALAETKRTKREEKKAAREALTEAWCDREELRKVVLSSGSAERAMEFRDSTRNYHERRVNLESLMGNGKLNGEDARVYPKFADLDLSAPKARPDGALDIQRKQKDEKAAQTARTGESAHRLTSNTNQTPRDGTADETEQAQPEKSESDVCKGKLVIARKLLQQAQDHFEQPRPQSNVSYLTWKKDGNAKLERAKSFYRTKRKMLAAACSDGTLPDDLAAEFPDI